MIKRQRSIISTNKWWEIDGKKAWVKASEGDRKPEVDAGSGTVHFEEKIKEELILYNQV